MHIFAKGGHGYGLRTAWQGEKNRPVSAWPSLFETWIKRTTFMAK